MSNNKRQSNLFIPLLAFYSCLMNVISLNWQGYGNISASNLTDIWEFIGPNLLAAQTNGTAQAYQQFTRDFSSHLNKLWDPAWNVAMTQDAQFGSWNSKDIVLYGYAFRDHWMWYSGYQVRTDKFNFVLWKDYNCQNWLDVDQNNYSDGFSSTQTTNLLTITKQFNSASLNDIWGSGKKIVEGIKGLNGFDPNGAYSVIVSQEFSNGFYGRICAVGNKVHAGSFYSVFLSNYGYYLLFQTR